MLNGVAQSLVWIPLMRLLSLYLEPEDCARACLRLNTTGPAGMFAGYGVSAFALLGFGWQASFFITAALMCGIALVWLRGLRRPPRTEGAAELRPVSDITKGKRHLRRILVVSAFGPIAVSCCLHGALKEGVSVWLPTYFAETFSLSASASAALAMILPVTNLTGVFLARKMMNRMSGGEISAVAFFFAVVAAVIPLLGLAEGSMWISLTLTCLITSGMTAVNVLFITLIPLQYTKTGAISWITGVLNAVTYLGSAAASYGFGSFAASRGWDTARLVWCAAAAAAVLICMTARTRWGKFRACGGSNGLEDADL
jgi:OPA family glycerol-3-phosphate transporter-like MFS transporter